MTADRWQTKENAEFLRQLGFVHGLMRLNSGHAVLKDTTFSDGTIEFDVNTIGRGSPGIAFRQQDDDILVRQIHCSNMPLIFWRVVRYRGTSGSPPILITCSQMHMGFAGINRTKRRIRPRSSSIVRQSYGSHKSASAMTAERLPLMF
jgi:hypothetical protein